MSKRCSGYSIKRQNKINLKNELNSNKKADRFCLATCKTESVFMKNTKKPKELLPRNDFISVILFRASKG